jgi:hypothetical protein
MKIWLLFFHVSSVMGMQELPCDKVPRQIEIGFLAQEEFPGKPALLRQGFEGQATTVEQFFAQRSNTSSVISARTNDTIIHIAKDESSTDTEDTVSKSHHYRRMITTNTITGLLAVTITAGVTLAIHFSECKK